MEFLSSTENLNWIFCISVRYRIFQKPISSLKKTGSPQFMNTHSVNIQNYDSSEQGGFITSPWICSHHSIPMVPWSQFRWPSNGHVIASCDCLCWPSTSKDKEASREGLKLLHACLQHSPACLWLPPTAHWFTCGTHAHPVLLPEIPPLPFNYLCSPGVMTKTGTARTAIAK